MSGSDVKIMKASEVSANFGFPRKIRTPTTAKAIIVATKRAIKDLRSGKNWTIIWYWLPV